MSASRTHTQNTHTLHRHATDTLHTRHGCVILLKVHSTRQYHTCHCVCSRVLGIMRSWQRTEQGSGAPHTHSFAVHFRGQQPKSASRSKTATTSGRGTTANETCAGCKGSARADGHTAAVLYGKGTHDFGALGFYGRAE